MSFEALDMVKTKRLAGINSKTLKELLIVNDFPLPTIVHSLPFWWRDEVERWAVWYWAKNV